MVWLLLGEWCGKTVSIRSWSLTSPPVLVTAVVNSVSRPLKGNVCVPFLLWHKTHYPLKEKLTLWMKVFLTPRSLCPSWQDNALKVQTNHSWRSLEELLSCLIWKVHWQSYSGLFVIFVTISNSVSAFVCASIEQFCVLNTMFKYIDHCRFFAYEMWNT